MNRSDLHELERLAAKHSVEIHRLLPFMLDDELRGHLNYLRRIDSEARASE